MTSSFARFSARTPRRARLAVRACLILLFLACARPARGDTPPSADLPWAFLPLSSAPPPPVRAKDSAFGLVRTPIDTFLVRARAARGLVPATETSRRAWLRRVSYDLTGLPPAPEETAAFLADTSPDACERVVDRLLASPLYGERWARHWLDVVRYADSDGFAIDSERPTLWRYRDYVVRAFNEGRSMREFFRAQIAGDELGSADGLVAIGFYRLGPWEADNMVPAARRQDYLNEITSAIGSAFLGLTFGCARCHDHKYDPVTAADYYRLQAFLAPLERREREAPLAAGELTAVVAAQREASNAEIAALEARRDTLRLELRRRLAAGDGAETTVDDETLAAAIRDAGKEGSVLTAEDRKKLEEAERALSQHNLSKRLAGTACAIANPGDGAELPVTRVLLGGSLDTPGDEVTPGFPGALARWDGALFEEVTQAGAHAAGRRTLLARWLTSDENPLPARVFVNRIWQHHFGRGLVATPNDFGRNGSGVSHPELLDFLARRFMGGGWRLKPLHRMIVLSSAYRLSTRHERAAELSAIDPENRYLWRARLRRLEAEAVRDAMLAVSGELRLAPGGPGFYEQLPEELGRNFPFFSWEPSPPELRRRRSLYMFQRRNLIHPFLEAFEAADPSESCERRQDNVNVAQVFSLFNSAFAHRVAASFAARLRAETAWQAQTGDPDALIDRAFELAFGRRATPGERGACAAFLDVVERPGSEDSGDDGRLTDLCLVILNANEFLYLQ